MATCLIGLGSNLGDRRGAIDQACSSLQAAMGALIARSSLHVTHAIGGPPGQPEFFNAAALIETMQTPDQVLATLMEVEQQLGRQRAERWGARLIDLDLLLYDLVCVDTPALVVPHRRMAFRRFVLAPAVEIAPSMVHPPTGFTVQELWERLAVRPIHVAVLGDDAAVVGRAAALRCVGRFFDRRSLAESDSSASGIHLVRRASEYWNRFAAAASPPIISDFWIGEWLPPEISRPEWQVESPRKEECGHFAAESLAQPLAAPHLIIWLQSTVSVTTRDRMALRHAVQRPRQFPVLTLTDTTIDTAVAETTAAIQAME